MTPPSAPSPAAIRCAGVIKTYGSGNAFPSLYFVGLLLFAITFVLNLVSERFVRRVRRMG